MKICTKCKTTKTLDEFHKDRQKKDGLHPSCRTCCSKTKVKEVLSIEYKRCTKCKKAILKSLFSKDSKKPDGYYSSCKECVRKKYGVVRKRREPGTVYIDNSGYKRVAGSSVRQHREIMESVLGRKLSRDEHVHHKNGDKTDNRLENLEILTASEHHKEHFAEVKDKLKSNYRRVNKCIVCGSEYTTRSGKAKYCSVKCKNITRKEYMANYLKTYKKPHKQATPHLTRQELFEYKEAEILKN
jgi:hypothetical protein